MPEPKSIKVIEDVGVGAIFDVKEQTKKSEDAKQSQDANAGKDANKSSGN